MLFSKTDFEKYFCRICEYVSSFPNRQFEIGNFDIIVYRSRQYCYFIAIFKNNTKRDFKNNTRSAFKNNRNRFQTTLEAISRTTPEAISKTSSKFNYKKKNGIGSHFQKRHWSVIFENNTGIVSIDVFENCI